MFLSQGKDPAPARPTGATWGNLTGHHVRAAPRRAHAARPLPEARLESARQSRARASPAAARLKAQTPPQRPGAAHVAGRAPRHVRQEAEPRSRPERESGLVLRADAQRPLSALNPEVFPPRMNHPQHLPKLFTSPPTRQKPRDLPANHARLPAAWRPRTRPGRRGGPPPRGAARARAPRETGLDVRGCKSEASYLCELHHDGGY